MMMVANLLSNAKRSKTKPVQEVMRRRCFCSDII